MSYSVLKSDKITQIILFSNIPEKERGLIISLTVAVLIFTPVKDARDVQNIWVNTIGYILV